MEPPAHAMNLLHWQAFTLSGEAFDTGGLRPLYRCPVTSLSTKSEYAVNPAILVCLASHHGSRDLGS